MSARFKSYAFSVAGLTAVFVVMQTFVYWEQCQWPPLTLSGFRFSERAEVRIYRPGLNSHSAIHLDVNRLGLMGQEPDSEKPSVLFMGTCTGIDLTRGFLSLWEGRAEVPRVMSSSRFHQTLREVRLQWDVLSREFRPSLVVLNLGTIPYRDIEFYGRDIWGDTPERVVYEKAFGHFGGGVQEWFGFQTMKWLNRFYFSRDSAAIESEKIRRGWIIRHQGHLDPATLNDFRPVLEKTLPHFRREFAEIVHLIRSRGVGVIVHTPPVERRRSSGRELECLEAFRRCILESSAELGVECVDLGRMMEDDPALHFRDEPYHLSGEGARRAARLMEKSLLEELKGLSTPAGIE